MKTNKSPGLDGLTVEFYRTFWDIISELLIDSYNEAFRDGSLSDSRNFVLMSLIFKKNDRSDIKNYRPISLANIDYKILAFVLANRLQNVLSKLISHDQTGYVKGRFIGFNIRKTLDIINYLEKHNKTGLLLLLNFEKAFDTIEWDFILKTLDHYKFGEEFIRWIMLLYSSPSAIFKNNGWLSGKISLHRGIRQGCPVSALLFILVVEVLADILKTSSIEGIMSTNAEKELTLCQYADDMAVFLKDEEHLSKVLDIVNEFGTLAGPMLNKNKTEGIWLGNRTTHNISKGGSIKWPINPVRYLGIYIGKDKEACIDLNWWSKLREAEKTLNSWKRRNLTLFGKITIIKSLIVPKVLYPAHFLPTPEGFIKKLENVMYSFIWNSTDKIERKTLIEHGGLKMVDIESQIHAIKGAWVQKIIKSQSDWSIFGHNYIDKFGQNILVEFNFKDVKQFPLLKSIPLFYQNILIAFNRAKSLNKPVTKQMFLEEIIWGNLHFTNLAKETKNREVLYFKNWIDAGIIYVHSLKFTEGQIDVEYIYSKIKDKGNIYSEILYVKEALRPFSKLINTFQVETHDRLSREPGPIVNENQCKSKRMNSKHLYTY